MFMENNTKEHYEGLSTLFTHVLSIDIQNGLLLLLPVLFSSQSIVVQKLVHLDSSNLLIQYLDSSTVSPAILLKHNPTVLSQSTSQYNFISSLDTVAEGEEEEEEPEQISIQPSSDSHMEIDLSALDNHITLTGTFPVIPDEIPLVDEMEEQSPYGVSSPEGTYYQILELNIMALDAIADAISSEELKQYIQNVLIIPAVNHRYKMREHSIIGMILRRWRKNVMVNSLSSRRRLLFSLLSVHRLSYPLLFRVIMLRNFVCL